MKIYTGQTSGKKMESLLRLNLGIMITSHPKTSANKNYKATFCALDNGAFSCYTRGYPFMERAFLDTLHKCYKNSFSFDFIVCPDIVAGGMASLDFSMHWAKNKLIGCPKLALAVQDGMEPSDITEEVLQYFSHVFVGGTKKWKLDTAEEWIRHAHDTGKKAHVGRAGRLTDLLAMHSYGADSVDSASFTINSSFHIVEEFYRLIGKEVVSDVLSEENSNSICKP